MTPWLQRSAPLLSLAVLLALAVPSGLGDAIPQPRGSSLGSQQQDDDAKLPNGKSQKEAILKAEFDQNTKDAAELSDLAQQLQQDIEKNGYTVVSMATVKKTEDIEKLAKKIRSRLRHY
ncbi:MAG TPA: hypothetical protein VML19_32795 [Verrucomicrobiae bacterium]|nr:hypothetical protein [Verrucomicrobiae bacterium]